MIEKTGTLNTHFGPERRKATFSDCMNFRYSLEIRFPINMLWDQDRAMAWICMNPSTADEMQDDPTLRRCKDFAQQWGFGRMTMLNAFAFRSTDPTGLKYLVDPRGGPLCDQYIAMALLQAEMVVLGWGKDAVAPWRRDELFKLLAEKREKVYALDVNKDGSPKHPLYIPAAKTPFLYSFEVPSAIREDETDQGQASIPEDVGAGDLPAHNPLSILRW